MLIAIALAAVIVPPQGVYTYTLEQGGSTVLTSSVAVAHAPGGTIVTEVAKVSGEVVNTSRVFDPDLRETEYVAITSSVQAHVILSPEKATLSYAGKSQDIALPSDVPVFVTDGLLTPAAMLPAFVAAHHASKLTFLAVNGLQVLDVTVDSGARPARPHGVSAKDVSLSINVGTASQSIWYDPATMVVDEFDPAPGARVRLTSTKPLNEIKTVTPAPTATPFPTRFRSRDVSFVSADGTTLAGTMSYPDGSGPFPAVILIQGSGVSDRNETVGPNQIFAELADALNSRGYAVLRYDKRLRQVARMGAVQDGVAATAFVGTDTQIDPKRIYFLGHSEGGEIVLGIALAGAPLRGVVMLSPLPMNYTAMIERQIVRNHVAAAGAAQLRAAEKQPYVASFNSVDPVAEIRDVLQPLLLVHGSKDANVTNEDIAPFVASAKAAHPRSFTDVELVDDDHLFARLAPGKTSDGLEYYTNLTLDPRLIDALAAWLSTH